MMHASHRPLRIGFVVHVMQVAGAEVLVRETIHRLGPAIVPTVFCLDSVGRIGEELVAEGIDLVCLNRRPGWDFSVSRKLSSAARERRIEVFHAHQYTPFFYAALAKPLIQPMPKLILTEHGRHYPDLVSPPRRAVNRLVLDHFADAINACSKFSARALCTVDGFRGNRIDVIENGVDLSPYEQPADKIELRMQLGLAPNRRVIVHVARHHPVKDQRTLIRGFASITLEFSDVDLVLVGDGPLRGELEDLVRELRIVDRVKFVGIRSDVPQWLRAADIFALTSLSEAASLTLLEAMAAGLPVVVTAVGGNPEIARHEQEGLLFPRGDAEQCADAFRRLLHDKDLRHRLGAAGHARVHANYTLAKTVERYERLYRWLR